MAQAFRMFIKIFCKHFAQISEYEVFKNTLSITILRSTGVISNPYNTCRTTPAGPPLEVPDAQQAGENTAEFSIGFFDIKNWKKYIDEVFPPIG